MNTIFSTVAAVILVAGPGLAGTALSSDGAHSGDIILHDSIYDYSDDYSDYAFGGFDDPRTMSVGGYRVDIILDEAFFDYDGELARAHNDGLNEPVRREEAEFAAFDSAPQPVIPWVLEALD